MLNRKLRWALGVTLLLTAGTLLMPEREQPLRFAADRPSDRAATSTAAHEALGTAPPGETERQTFSVPERDPFADPTPPPATCRTARCHQSSWAAASSAGAASAAIPRSLRGTTIDTDRRADYLSSTASR